MDWTEDVAAEAERTDTPQQAPNSPAPLPAVLPVALGATHSAGDQPRALSPEAHQAKQRLPQLPASPEPTRRSYAEAAMNHSRQAARVAIDSPLNPAMKLALVLDSAIVSIPRSNIAPRCAYAPASPARLRLTRHTDQLSGRDNYSRSPACSDWSGGCPC